MNIHTLIVILHIDDLVYYYYYRQIIIDKLIILGKIPISLIKITFRELNFFSHAFAWDKKKKFQRRYLEIEIRNFIIMLRYIKYINIWIMILKIYRYWVIDIEKTRIPGYGAYKDRNAAHNAAFVINATHVTLFIHMLVDIISASTFVVIVIYICIFAPICQLIHAKREWIPYKR